MKYCCYLILMLFAALQSNAQAISGVVLTKYIPPLRTGKPITIVETHNDFVTPDGVRKHIVDYDESGMITKRNVYDKTGRLVAHWEFENDTALKKVLYQISMHYQGREEFTDTSLFSYDQKGLLVREEKRNGRWIRTTNFTNAVDALPVEAKTFSETGKLARQEQAIYNLDSNYMIIAVSDLESQWFYKDTIKIDYHRPCLIYKETVQQNERGDIIIRSGVNKFGQAYEFFSEYEYDGKGNWISLKVYQHNDDKKGEKRRQLMQHYTRAITYRK